MAPKFKWDDTSERKLLLTIIHVQGVATPKWDKVAEVMGGEVSGNAIRQKFDKMKKEAGVQFGDVNDEEAPKTPVSRSKKGNGEKSSGKRKVDRMVEEAEDEETPTKKVKAEQSESEGEMA